MTMKRCVFAALLALCVILTLLPAAALANAIEEYNTFAAGLHDPKEDGTYSYIYFGMNGETPIKWRVLDSKNTNILELDTNYNEHGVFLLSENFLGGPLSFRSYTDTPPTNANAYQASDLRTTLNGFGTTMFTEVEQSIIMAATKSDDNILNSDRLFLLSAQEAGNTEGGIAAAYFPKGEENLKVTTGEWWLRSPASENNVSTIKSDGTMGQAAPNESLYLRPAVNIHSIDTVFFSDANDEKAGNGVSSTLAEVPASTPTEWKLTLQLPPDNRNGFAYEASGSTRIGNKLTIEYLNAPTGGNEYISAIIQETNKVPSCITHYGRILLPTSADGKATIILPNNMENKELLVFTEQCNGPKKTDYISSLLYPVELNPPTCAIEANPTSLSFAPAYEDGSLPAAQTVTLTNVGNQSVTIDLPTLDHYTVTAGVGFSGGRATLADTSATATFTVQPSPELGVGEYNGTIDIDVPDGVSASVPVSFTVKSPVAAIQPDTASIVKGNRVYLGNYTQDGTDYDVPWLVLDAGDSSAFLLSEYLLGSSRFDSNTSRWNYTGSMLNTKMDELYNDDATLFTSLERGMIVKQTNLSCTGGDEDNPDSPPVPEAYLYPLSTSEAAAQGWSSAVLQAKSITAQEGNAGKWWLRSSRNTSPRGVTEDGTMGVWDNADYLSGVRPAFHLDLLSPKVLFASAAADGSGKSASGMDGNRLGAVSKGAPTAWKLTLLDSGRNGFTVESAEFFDNRLVIGYSGATIGANEYISAIVKDASGTITHYGRVKQTDNSSVASAFVEFDPPADMTGKTLYVFSEQYNGPCKTDYASDLIPVNTVKYALEANPASLSFGRAYAGGTWPAAQTVTLTNTGNQSVTISLPTLTNYTFAAGNGFSGNTATLAVGGTATFTVQPSPGLDVGEYNGTITIGENAASGSDILSNGLPAQLPVSFTVKTPVAAIQPGTGGFLSPSQHGGRSAYSHVYFGMDSGNPIPWRVLDASKTNTGADGVFLLSEEVLSSGTHQYINHLEARTIPYQSSILRQVLETNDNSIRKTFFSNLEQGAMMETTKPAVNPNYSDSLDKDKLFPLSAYETYSSAYFVVDLDKPSLASEDRVGKDVSGVPQEWWLRSPADGYSAYAHWVLPDGRVGDGYRNTSHYLRPAFNLIPSTVLFTSAEGGKAAAGMDGGLAAVGKNTADYWKLTLLDSGRNGFDAHSTSVLGNVLTIAYSGAATGANEFISAIVKDASGNITCYGRVAQVSSASGTVQIDLSDVTIASTDKLYLFSEQYNGEPKTDYASPLRAVQLPHTIAASPNNAAYGSVTGGGLYMDNAPVTLMATANPSYHFVKWMENNGDAGTANTLIFNATASRTLTAVFAADANPPASENTITHIVSGQSYRLGDIVTFTAVGGGMSNTAPYLNDMRWLPTAWQTNPSGNFSTGYTQSFSTAGMSAGPHTLTVTFVKQRYNGAAWENLTPAVTDQKSVPYVLAAANGQSADLPPKTGDSAAPPLWLCLLFVTGVLTLTLAGKRKAHDEE